MNRSLEKLRWMRDDNINIDPIMKFFNWTEQSISRERVCALLVAS
jgi:hypothetical protein